MTKKSDERTYEAWDKRWSGSHVERHITLVGRRMFKAKKKALGRVLRETDVRSAIEVGCGLGFTLEVLMDAGIQYEGIDVSARAVSFCKNKGLNATQMRLDKARGEYDLVLSDGMLEHFLNFEPHAKKMMGLSRKYVLLIQPNHDSFSGRTLAYLAGLFRGRTNVYEYNYRIGDFIRVFEDAGFLLVKNLPVYFNVFRLLLFKRR